MLGRMRGKRNVIAMSVLLVVTVAALLALLKLIAPGSLEQTQKSTITVSGKTVCLPPKDTSGPTTLECAVGLLGDDGRYYALIGLPQQFLSADFGRPLTVDGTLEVPMLGTKYNSSGTIVVSSAVSK